MKKLYLLIAVLLLSGCAQKNDAPPMDYAGANDIAYMLQEEWAGTAPDENTDARVLFIAERAKTDAENISEESTDQALAYLAVNFNSDPFGGNLVMESCMYFGALLDAAYDDSDVRSEVGWDAFKSLKSVYRGWESEEDAKPAVEQTLDGLLELGYLTAD